jgi:hypothetical protein
MMKSPEPDMPSKSAERRLASDRRPARFIMTTLPTVARLNMNPMLVTDIPSTAIPSSGMRLCRMPDLRAKTM